MRPKLLAKNPLWITNNHPTIVVNFHQDFMARTQSVFSQGQMVMVQSICPNILEKLCY